MTIKLSLALPMAAALLASTALAFPAPAADDDTAADACKAGDLPLEATRTIEFETDEGTWISLDLSPDGDTLLMELLGDIYTLPVAGGDATPLLTGMAFQSQAVWSPDGLRIAYLSDADGAENLWIADADGENAKKLSSLTDGGMASPEWSADGDYVYVSQVPKSIGAMEIWMYHRLGGKGIQITKSLAKGPDTPRAQQPFALGVSASSDGRYLYYASKNGGFKYNADSFDWSVVRRDLAEGTTDTIVTSAASAVRPVVSPDGTQLVYGSRFENETGLRVRDLVTGADRWLAYPVTRDDQESRSTRDLLPDYSFTPDGSAIITTSGGHIERIALADGARNTIPFTAKVTLDIGPDLRNQTADPTGPVVVRMANAPKLSPDGGQVVFSALGELYRMDLEDGASPVKFDNAGAQVFQPSWSADGRWITYVSWTATGGHVWKMRSNGRGRPTRISETSSYYSEPAFTPSGEEIVAIRRPNHQFNEGRTDAQRDLIALPASGGAPRVILPGSGFSSVHFGDDPGRVYLYGTGGPFSSADGGGLFSIRLDGTDRREHLKTTGKGLYNATKPVPATDMRSSPDGRYALAKIQQNLHLVAVPQIGKKATVVDLGGPSLPVKTLSDVGVDFFDWSADGKTILWSVGSTFYTQALAEVNWEEPEEDEDEEAEAAAEEAAETNGETETATDGEDSDCAEDEEADETDEAEEKPYQTFTAVIEVPRDNPAGSLLMTGATVFTMGEAGVLENADVLIVDGRFQAVGASGSLDVPAGTETRDMSGKFITPGFIDTHGHWGNAGRGGVVEPHYWPFVANVAYGVTAGLDVQTSTTDIFAYQDMVEAGRMIGLRAWSTGPGVFSDTNIDSKEDAVNVLTRYRDHYRTKNIKSYIAGNRKQRQYIVQAAAELGMMPTTEGGLDLKLDLTHMIDSFAGNEHNLPIAPLYKDIITLAAESRIGYTPTLLVTYGGPFGENYFYTHMNPHDDPKVNRFWPHSELDQVTKRRPWFRDEEYTFPRVADSALDIQRAGGLVGVGSHGQFQGLGYHWEMWALGSGNGTPMEVLKAATIDGARIIGHETEVGSIEPGKFADLVVLNADPRADLHNTLDIHRVMMNGRLYDDDTMNELWPRQKTLPDFWFKDQSPSVD